MLTPETLRSKAAPNEAGVVSTEPAIPVLYQYCGRFRRSVAPEFEPVAEPLPAPELPVMDVTVIPLRPPLCRLKAAPIAAN
jgi:hypothetical protein